MSLSAAAVRGAAPRARAYKLADDKGLVLFVAPTGLRSWRYRYRFARAERLLVLGSFPEMSLSEARDRRDEARRLLRAGLDPSAERRRARAADELASARGAPFEQVARAWHARETEGWSPVHASDVLTSLERDVFPAIGTKSLEAIDPPTIVAVLRAVERRGAVETARRLKQRISSIYALAIAEGWCVTTDPAAAVGKALKRTKHRRKQPAQVELAAARAVLAAAQAAGGTALTKAASQLLALTVVRPGVVRAAAWCEFEGIDWSTGAAADPLWRVPAARMKLVLERKSDDEFEHLVPLSAQAVALLLELHRISGAGALLFPNQRDPRRGLSESAIGGLYARAGFAGAHVPHGWRAAFSTIMNERHRADRAVIDLALAHLPKDKVEAAYNRAEHLERRCELLQEWADLLGPPSGGFSVVTEKPRGMQAAGLVEPMPRAAAA